MTVSYVIDNFSRAVETYDKYASIQAIAASELSLTLSQVEASIPQGRILEFGCGTGIFSRYLAACLPGRTVIFSDASSEMVEVCRLNIRDLNSDKFQQRIFSCLDATRIQTEERFSMIAASFVLQWLPDLKGAIDALLSLLVPGGYLLFSVPGHESHPEWKEVCALNQLTYTANSLPQLLDLVSVGSAADCTFQIFSRPHSLDFEDARSFFKTLKLSGCSTAMRKASTSSNIRQTIERWDMSSYGKVAVTYQLMSGYFRKPSSEDEAGTYAVETKLKNVRGQNFVFCNRYRF